MAKETQVSRRVKQVVKSQGGDVLRFEDMFAAGLPDTQIFWPATVVPRQSEANAWIELKTYKHTLVPKFHMRIAQRAWHVKQKDIGRFCGVLGYYDDEWFFFEDDTGWKVLMQGGQVAPHANYRTKSLKEMLEWIRARCRQRL